MRGIMGEMREPDNEVKRWRDIKKKTEIEREKDRDREEERRSDHVLQ